MGMIGSHRVVHVSMGGTKSVVLGSYGENWRVQRKLFHQYMNKGSIRQYWPAMERESRECVLRVLDNNQKFFEETRL